MLIIYNKNLRVPSVKNLPANQYHIHVMLFAPHSAQIKTTKNEKDVGKNPPKQQVIALIN